jgi:hypothetical protein
LYHKNNLKILIDSRSKSTVFFPLIRIQERLKFVSIDIKHISSSQRLMPAILAIGRQRSVYQHKARQPKVPLGDSISTIKKPGAMVYSCHSRYTRNVNRRILVHACYGIKLRTYLKHNQSKKGWECV